MLYYETVAHLASLDGVELHSVNGETVKFRRNEHSYGWFLVDTEQEVQPELTPCLGLEFEPPQTPPYIKLDEASQQAILTWGLRYNALFEAAILKTALQELQKSSGAANVEIYLLKDLRLAEKDRSVLMLKIEGSVREPEPRLSGYMLGNYGLIEKHTVAEWRYLKVTPMTTPLYNEIMDILKS